jgi:hypothetical protein
MRLMGISRRLMWASGAELFFVLALLMPSPVGAQTRPGVGLVIAVDLEKKALVLETRSGSERIVLAPTATILDDHGRALGLSAVKAGDAVSYQVASSGVTSLRVARQFWAVPNDR